MSARRATVGQILVLGALGANLAWGEAVTGDGGRYQLILDRNPFSLKDPPPPPVAPPPSNPPPVEVNLKISGLSLTSEGKHAYFVVLPTPGKNTETLYRKLAEGDRHDDVEVLSIDYEEGEVTVKNAGQQVTLSLRENAPDPTGPAAVPGARPRVPSPPGARPAIPLPARNAAAVRSTMPTRGGRSPVMVPRAGSASRVAPIASRGAQASLSAGPGSGGVSFSRSVPARPVRTVPAQTEPIEPAMQWLLMKAQEEQARSEGMPMPPTPPIPGMP